MDIWRAMTWSPVMRCCCTSGIHQFTHTFTQRLYMQHFFCPTLLAQLSGTIWGSPLHKDTLERRMKEPGIEPQTFWLVDDPPEPQSHYVMTTTCIWMINILLLGKTLLSNRKQNLSELIKMLNIAVKRWETISWGSLFFWKDFCKCSFCTVKINT